jgi:EAL and modified HD-GYP domain-containing signal transduction protein
MVPFSAPPNAFVARQPILDVRQRTCAYELLFRSSSENCFPSVDGSYASSRILHDSLHVFGLGALSARQRLYINVTRDVLVKELVRALPPELVTVEVLETIEPDAEVVAACAHLAQDGYEIALDDFVFRPGFEALIAVADVIKVDFTQTLGAERGRVVERFGSPRVRMLAEKIETRAEFEEAVHLGYELFQGYFFARPEIISARDIPPLKVNCLRLLTVVNEPELDFQAVEAIVRQEISIAVKLLKQLNSAALGGHHRIQSIRHALELLGEVQFRRWVSLLALTGAGGSEVPGEVVLASLTRARFCESVAAMTPLPLPTLPSFLVGLLSMVDVLVARPIDEVLRSLAIDPEVEQALLRDEGRLAHLVPLAIAHERGDWAALTREALALGVDELATAEVHQASLLWAHEVLAGTTV